MKYRVETQFYDGKLNALTVKKPHQITPLRLDFEYGDNGLISAVDLEGPKRDMLTVPEITRIISDKYVEQVRLIREATLKEPITIEAVLKSSSDNVILFDDMEGLLKWYSAGGDVAQDNTVAFHGSNSIKLTCGAGDTSTNCSRRFPLPLSRKVEVGGVFAFNDHTKLENITFRVRVFDGERYQEPAFRYDQANLLASFQDAGGTYQTAFLIPRGLISQATSNMFHRFKFSMDFNTRLMLSCQINDVEQDLSNQAIRSATSTSRLYAELTFLLDNVAGQEVIAWFDDVLITQIP